MRTSFYISLKTRVRIPRRRTNLNDRANLRDFSRRSDVLCSKWLLYLSQVFISPPKEVFSLFVNQLFNFKCVILWSWVFLTYLWLFWKFFVCWNVQEVRVKVIYCSWGSSLFGGKEDQSIASGFWSAGYLLDIDLAFARNHPVNCNCWTPEYTLLLSVSIDFLLPYDRYDHLQSRNGLSWRALAL